MNADELRALQTPLKERYRSTPEGARITLVGFQQIRLSFTLDTDAPDEQLATLLRLTERYCVVFQTLAHPPAISVARRAAKIAAG